MFLLETCHLCWCHPTQSKTFVLIQQVIELSSQDSLLSVSCPDPDLRNRWDNDLEVLLCSLLKPAVSHLSLFLKKVPPYDQSASCRHSLMAEHIDALLESCYSYSCCSEAGGYSVPFLPKLFVRIEVNHPTVFP